MATRVDFETRDGGKAQGEIVEPAGSGKAPAVVLIQEWWGVNDHIRSLLDRLAQAGFLAMAPDLYDGKTTKNSEEASALMNGLDWPKALGKIQGAERYLAAHPRSNGSVGVMGFCMGGALSLASALQIPDFKSVVCFYGLRSADEDWSRVRAPIMAHVAKHDGWVKPENMQAVQKKVQAAGKSMEVHVYDADHAFVNDTRPEVHNPAAAREAWDRSMKFLHHHLG